MTSAYTTAATAAAATTAAASASVGRVVQQWSPELLSRYKVLLFDCDGVLWHESAVYNGAIDTLRALQSRGHTLLFVTNNSGKSRSAYFAKMRSMGFELKITDANILSSSYALAEYVSNDSTFNRDNDSVLYIGDTGIADELALKGVKSISARSVIGDGHWPRSKLSRMELDESVHSVVVGIDDHLSYSSIALALVYLKDGDRGGRHRQFIATNLDSTLPTDGFELPGAGACCAAIATASGRTPINLGKPEPLMFQLAQSQWQFDSRECLMIGDRLDTDIAFGVRSGIDTVMVETGINRRKDVEDPSNTIIPTYIVDNVNQLIQL